MIILVERELDEFGIFVNFSETNEYKAFDEPMDVEKWDVVEVLRDTLARLERRNNRNPNRPHKVYFCDLYESKTGPWKHRPAKVKNHLMEFYQEITDEDRHIAETALLEVNSQARSL